MSTKNILCSIKGKFLFATGNNFLVLVILRILYIKCTLFLNITYWTQLLTGISRKYGISDLGILVWKAFCPKIKYMVWILFLINYFVKDAIRECCTRRPSERVNLVHLICFSSCTMMFEIWVKIHHLMAIVTLLHSPMTNANFGTQCSGYIKMKHSINWMRM